MVHQQSRSAYQFAAASSASVATLHQLAYSQIAQDLLCAAAAVRQADISARCAASNHALLLLGHLDSWVDGMKEPALAQSLRAFYVFLRHAILNLQIAPDAAAFERTASLLLDTRTAWHQKEQLLSERPRDFPASSAEATPRLSLNA